jgi:ATP synthase protein I
MPEQPDNGSRTGQPHAAFEERLKDALAKQAAEQAARDALEERARAARASGAAWRIMIDLVAAVGLTGALGFGVDRLLGTSPFGLVLGLGGGFVLGMWLAARRAAEIQRQAAGASGQGRSPGPSPPKGE